MYRDNELILLVGYTIYTLRSFDVYSSEMSSVGSIQIFLINRYTLEWIHIGHIAGMIWRKEKEVGIRELKYQKFSDFLIVYNLNSSEIEWDC